MIWKKILKYQKKLRKPKLDLICPQLGRAFFLVGVILDLNKLIFHEIFDLGTLWCGVNDIAEDFRKLGANWRLDKCCRAHDHCPVKVQFFLLYCIGFYMMDFFR